MRGLQSNEDHAEYVKPGAPGPEKRAASVGVELPLFADLAENSALSIPDFFSKNRKMSKDKPFATEVDLCARFIDGVDQDQWIVLAETASWDILLVRREDGFQIGIQAKLKLNLKVIEQCIECCYTSPITPGPDCRAILVPSSESGFDNLTAYIGLTVIRVREKAAYISHIFDPQLPTIKDRGWRQQWHEWCPTVRHKLPEYVPDVPAGAPAPTQLTDWKIKAMKIAILLERRGYVTRADFKAIGIDHRRWLRPASWLLVEDGRYVRGHMPNFKAQHPVVWEQIAADFEKWKPKEEARLL